MARLNSKVRKETRILMANNQYQNDWDGWDSYKEDSTQNPYYNQPTHSPYKNEGFAVAAMVCAALALVTTCVPTLAFMFGCTGIFFALMGRRKGKRPSAILRTATTLACVGFGISLCSCGYFFLVTLPKQLEDPTVRAYLQQILEQYSQLQGNALQESLGIDWNQLLNNH